MASRIRQQQLLSVPPVSCPEYRRPQGELFAVPHVVMGPTVTNITVGLMV